MVINNYNHSPGKHCITTALRNYFNYYGINITEAMTFGLDCGLGFCYKKYNHLEKIPPFYTGGRTYSWVEDICENLNLKHKRVIFKNSHDAWIDLKRKIDKNEPVIIELDKSKLDYWNGVLREVPFHMVLVVGYDEEKKTVLIADSYEERIEKYRLDNNLHIASIENLIVAREGIFQWGRIDNAVHEIEISNVGLLNLKHSIKKAIKRNSFLYLSKDYEDGAAGLLNFCHEIVKLPEILPIKFFLKEKNRNISPLRIQLLVSGKMFDEVGTGGGNFRTLYYKFLKESSKIFDGDKELLLTAKYFKESSSLWTVIASDLCRISTIREDDMIKELEKVQEKLFRCLELERLGFEILQTWSSKL